MVDVLWLTFLSGTGIYEIIPGFLCSLAAAVIVTLLDRQPGEEVTAIFDNATAEGFDE